MNDETTDFKPKFDESGLMPAIAIDHATSEILMLAYMNEEALRLTRETGEVHYWSRSRREIWHKGATSGHIQTVHAMHIDCDQDAVLLKVTQKGAACHTGRKTCFYRELPLLQKDAENDRDLPDSKGNVQLIFTTEA